MDLLYCNLKKSLFKNLTYFLPLHYPSWKINILKKYFPNLEFLTEMPTYNDADNVRYNYKSLPGIFMLIVLNIRYCTSYLYK